MVLPDLVAPKLDIVFCGTAAGTVSAAKRAYYAGPGNAFWPTLFRTGLTPYALKPQEYPHLAQWKMGLTDLAKHVFGSDRVVRESDYDVARLRGLVAHYRPRILAFTSKHAATRFVGREVEYGLLDEISTATRLFVLPSPSGAARRYWDEGHWRDLALCRSAGR